MIYTWVVIGVLSFIIVSVILLVQPKPACCFAVGVNVMLLVCGMSVAMVSGFCLFTPVTRAILDSNYVMMQLCTTAFVFSLMMIIKNATGIIVIWGKTSDQDDGCCDKCEQLVSVTGWFIYIAMEVIMIIFSIVLCCILTYTYMIDKEMESDGCPGIDFDSATRCDSSGCTDGDQNRMEASDCPWDFTIMTTTVNPTFKSHSNWAEVQNLFTMCGYYCKDNCSLARGNTSDTNKYLFQMTGKYCRREVRRASSFAKPKGCDNCDPQYITQAAAEYQVEKGASKTGLRNSLQFMLVSSGIPTAIFFYVVLTAQILNAISVAFISCQQNMYYADAIKEIRDDSGPDADDYLYSSDEEYSSDSDGGGVVRVL